VPGLTAVPPAEPRTRATSDPTFFLLHRPVKAWNEFRKMLSDAGSPAFPRKGPEAAGAAAALPERGHGPAAGQADAAVPPGPAVPIPGEEAVVVHARLPAQALRSRILEGTALVEAVLAVHRHRAQPAAGAALAGEAGFCREGGSRRAAAAQHAGLLQLQRAQQRVVIRLPWKQKPQRSVIANACSRPASRTSVPRWHGETPCPAPAAPRLRGAPCLPCARVRADPWATHTKTKQKKLSPPLQVQNKNGKKTLQPTSTPFLALVQKSLWSALVEQRPNSSLLGKELSQGLPHACMSRGKRKQKKTRVKMCFSLTGQRSHPARSRPARGRTVQQAPFPRQQRAQLQPPLLQGPLRGTKRAPSLAPRGSRAPRADGSGFGRYGSPAGSTGASRCLPRPFPQGFAQLLQKAQPCSCPGCSSCEGGRPLPAAAPSPAARDGHPLPVPTSSSAARHSQPSPTPCEQPTASPRHTPAHGEQSFPFPLLQVGFWCKNKPRQSIQNKPQAER